MLKKLFRCGKPVQWDILEKETVDEIIFRTTKLRNRVMLELMARGGMRIGEVLNLTPKDIDEQKLTITDPKSGKEIEVVFIPRKLATCLKDYIGMKGIKPGEKIFPITYSAARVMSKKAGLLVGVQLRPHDLRRHAATLCIQVRNTNRDRQQGHSAALQFGYDPKIPWEDSGC